MNALRLPAVASAPAVTSPSCQIEFLPDFTGFLRRYEHWDPGCDLIDASGATSRRLQFSVDGWTYVRLELVSLDNVSIGLGQVEGQAVRTLEPGSHRVLVGGPNVRKRTLSPGARNCCLPVGTKSTSGVTTSNHQAVSRSHWRRNPPLRRHLNLPQ